MKTVGIRRFAPRKTPVQKPPALTVEAIAEATIQVLLAVGLDRWTTTRVAEWAGGVANKATTFGINRTRRTNPQLPQGQTHT